MAIDINERIAAVATLATDGNLEVLQREPFSARLAGTGGPVVLRTYVFEPANIAVIEVSVLIARIQPCVELDRWITRVAPQLFNVHVAVRDLDDAAIVEVRSSLVAVGLTVGVFQSVLTLLTFGAARIASQLHTLLRPNAPPIMSSPPYASTLGRVADLSSGPARRVTMSTAFAGYL